MNQSNFDSTLVDQIRQGARVPLTVAQAIYRYEGQKLQQLRENGPLPAYAEELKKSIQCAFPEEIFSCEPWDRHYYDTLMSGDYIVQAKSGFPRILIKLTRDSIKLTFNRCDHGYDDNHPLLAPTKEFLRNYARRFDSVK